MAAGGIDTNSAIAAVEIYDPINQAWTPTGSMQTPRGAHTATQLPNGKILVAGGTSMLPGPISPLPFDPVLASAEIYDPASGTWSPTGSMSQPRQGHTALLLPNGKVLVTGGVSYFGGIFPTTAELYNPATGKWSPTFSLVSGRQDHFTALLPNGKVLAAGGFNTTDTGLSAELFDPETLHPMAVLLSQPTRIDSGEFQFAFRNVPGLGFAVLSSSDLAVRVEDWAIAGSAAEISPGRYQFTDNATNSPQRFYAVRLP